MRNEFPRGSTDVLEFKCTGPKGTGNATAVEGAKCKHRHVKRA